MRREPGAWSRPERPAKRDERENRVAWLDSEPYLDTDSEAWWVLAARSVRRRWARIPSDRSQQVPRVSK